MSEHTKGPWQAVKRAGSYTSPFIIQTEHGRHVANLTGSNLEPEGQSIGEAEANARLIAAAPELLEALKGLVAAYEAAQDREGFPTGYGLEKESDAFMRSAHAAIARATGEGNV